ncbi:hypothetical protein GCM10027299_44130 [Larkinella ripae]
MQSLLMKCLAVTLCFSLLLTAAGFGQPTLPDTFTALQAQLEPLPDSVQFERLNNFIRARVEQGNFMEATSAHQRMLVIAKRTGNQLFLAQYYSSAGYLAKNQGQPARAVVQFQRAAAIYQKTGKWHRQVTALERIGQTYADVRNLPLAENYYNQALAIAQKHNLPNDVSDVYSNLAVIYDLRKQYDKALAVNAQSIKIAQSIGADYSVSLLNQGIFLKNAGRYTESVAAYQRALQWAEAHQDTYLKEFIYHNLPNTLLQLNRLDEAEYYIRKSLKSVRQMPYQQMRLKDSYETLTAIYERRGQYRQALDYHKQWVVHRDSVFNAEKSRQLIEAETRFQTREKQQQIQHLDEDNLRQKQQVRGLIGGVSLLILLLGIMGWQYRALQRANRRVNQALTDLKRTQDQLIQKEKMAYLGELTAGIAHEIQNPLNFVNNFSEVSADLARELREELDKVDLPADDRSYLGDIVTDLTRNQEKINQHGQRAAGIVRGMLEHSRASTGERQSTDLNALADEYLRMAYHGLKAKEKDFNVALVTDFDDRLSSVETVPQDIGRVLLNLYNNAFYAVQEKQGMGQAGYQPTITVRTHRQNGQVELRVNDNGTSIPESVKSKIFQPFFTTKPTGQGTGLGLSLSYDIVTKGHGGTLEVETQPGEGTQMVVRLPG